MGAKENLNEAMFSMFGVGKAPESAAAAEPAAPAVEEKCEPQPAVKPIEEAPIERSIPHNLPDFSAFELVEN